MQRILAVLASSVAVAAELHLVEPVQEPVAAAAAAANHQAHHLALHSLVASDSQGLVARAPDCMEDPLPRSTEALPKNLTREI